MYEYVLQDLFASKNHPAESRLKNITNTFPSNPRTLWKTGHLRRYKNLPHGRIRDGGQAHITLHYKRGPITNSPPFLIKNPRASIQCWWAAFWCCIRNPRPCFLLLHNATCPPSILKLEATLQQPHLNDNTKSALQTSIYQHAPSTTPLAAGAGAAAARWNFEKRSWWKAGRFQLQALLLIESVKGVGRIG